MKTDSKPASCYGSRLVLMAIILSLAGLMIILSATSISAFEKHLSSYLYLEKQAGRLLLGLVVMAVASRFDYRRMRLVSFIALIACAVLLIICLIPGTYGIAPVIGGARRWITLGPLRFQPSELAKFFLICWAAGYLVQRKNLIGRFKSGFLPFIILTGIFCLLVVSQPDLSTALILLMLVLLVGYIGGIRPVHLILIGLLLTPLVAYKYIYRVSYRSERLASFLSGNADKSGMGYQAYQSRLALGSGGLTGIGLGNSKQKYFFLPAAHTDFILAITGEELGFLGCTAVVLTFFYFGWLGMRIAMSAPDHYGFLLASGLTLMIVFSALLNMAVVAGLTPTTGTPLPFLSYGGTNLIVSFWAVGILNNIGRCTAAAGAGKGKSDG
ncbi:MAG: putative lipid II flippase FtsW [Gemmatimonadota bacterium]|nr:putative lipid II flippase FtsW [Gemmatimonadota bacterium]